MECQTRLWGHWSKLEVQGTWLPIVRTTFVYSCRDSLKSVNVQLSLKGWILGLLEEATRKMRNERRRKVMLGGRWWPVRVAVSCDGGGEYLCLFASWMNKAGSWTINALPCGCHETIAFRPGCFSASSSISCNLKGNDALIELWEDLMVVEETKQDAESGVIVAGEMKVFSGFGHWM